MAWVGATSTSAGGNVTLEISGGYANISRNGNTVSGNLGLRFKFSGSWSSNSVVGVYGGTKYFAQNRTGGSGSHASSGETIYCKANQGNGYNTTETFPWSFSTTVSGSGGGNITITMSAGWTDWGGSAPYSYSFSVPYPALPSASFNLNILNPDGSEPYSTGEAGSVEQSINGGNYSRVYNESASSYLIGTTFNYRNFSPGTGRHLSSVSGISPNNTSGPWSATLGSSGLTVTFQTAWDTYTLSYNANGGSSTPSSQTKTYNQALNLANAISRNNSTANGYTVSFNGNGGTYSGSSKTATDTTSYSFSSWKSGNSGTTYSGGASYNENGNNIMTAQWSSSTSKGSITLPAASTVTRTYYTFNKWNTNSAGTGTNYNAGASYTPSSNTTLYATWTPNAPINLSLTYFSSTSNSITLRYSDEGVVTSRTVYYRKTGTSNYSSMAITSNPFTISGLDVDTNYDIYFKASNSANSSSTTAAQFSTLLINPTISGVISSNVLPFSMTITATASISPSRTLSYQFSKDNGANWTAKQSSNSYDWSGLNEETTYSMGVKVTAIHTGTNASDTSVQSFISVTTPADQAKIRRKVNNSWVKGKTYFKKNGEWVKAKKIYIKVNGEWKINNNQD